MSLILRFIDKRTAWTGDGRSSERAATDFRRDAQDVDGLSVFEVEDDAQRSVVVANRAISRGGLDVSDFIEVSRDLVEAIGPIVATPLGVMVEAAAPLHRSLDWPQEKLDE